MLWYKNSTQKYNLTNRKAIVSEGNAMVNEWASRGVNYTCRLEMGGSEIIGACFAKEYGI